MARRWLRGCRFLLASLILLLALFPVLTELARPIVSIAIVAGVVFAGVVGVHPGARRVRIAGTLAIGQIALPGVAAALKDNSSGYLFAVVVVLAATAILIIDCIYCVLRYVLQATHITHDQIYAGISVYLMLGFAFGCIYYLLNILDPGAFTVNNAEIAAVRSPDLMYFSFVTLATLGYGDITPVTKAARALAELEAVSGTLYMAVFMARLVSLHSEGSEVSEVAPADRTARPPREEADRKA